MSVVAEQLDLGGAQVRHGYDKVEGGIVHWVETPIGLARSRIDHESEGDPASTWWRAFLAGEVPKLLTPPVGKVRTVELFAGSGGLATGFRQGATEMGFDVVSAAAADQDAEAVAVYRSNHSTPIVTTRSVSTLVDFQFRGSREAARALYPPEIVDPTWADLAGEVDAVLAGPPCQGHSNLNNRTRRTDRRNELYLTVPAIALALDAPVVVIENVPAVVHDRLGVVAATRSILEGAGYSVATGTLRAARMGWPQTRSRFFLIARRGVAPLPLDEVAEAFAGGARSIMWAIEDLADADDDLVSDAVVLSPDNQRRIDWLFDNDAFDLPLAERPVCHQDGTRYHAVYGRLRPDEPAPTITTGFMTPGRGRYIHPTRRRVLTAREAARLQGFPDTYRFRTEEVEKPSKKSLAKWIGDAVPMPLGYAAAVSALGPGAP